MLWLGAAAFVFLYLANLTGSLLDDDEGTDFYEAWQLQQGQQPGIDFVAEQQPLFLLTGKTIIAVAGRSPFFLRLAATLQLLAGTFILTLVVRKIWGVEVAILTLGLVLSSGVVYLQGRLFRPDPMMFAWEMAGLAAVLLAVRREKRWLWAVAGFCYGVGVLWKLFGVFPVIGLAFYFLYQLWSEPARRREILVAGLFFAGPFLLTAAGVPVLLYSQLGFYYPEILGHHWNLGREQSLWQRIPYVLDFIAGFFYRNNRIFLLIPLLWWLTGKEMKRVEARPLWWQFVGPAVFFAISRPLNPRYLIYLTPVLAVILAWQLQLLFARLSQKEPRFALVTPFTMGGVMAVAILITTPSVPQLFARYEEGTLGLASYVATRTQPEEIVLSDYATINFLANRASIREASVIAGGRVQNEVITGAFLIRRIEEAGVTMVLVHVKGGSPPPHQLVKLVDYELFRAYLHANFELLTVYDRAGQKIEVYQRPDE
ncbi:MAG: glycosyltransferase family 39 protein [Chloroflexi bacterium]|nr:glycosyltransferase family 39 protein [Chloroflexota bacterium]MCI0575633.1 glycosyltransferase family 39 protein [Chloroflexota bacterium]